MSLWEILWTSDSVFGVKRQLSFCLHQSSMTSRNIFLVSFVRLSEATWGFPSLMIHNPRSIKFAKVVNEVFYRWFYQNFLYLFLPHNILCQKEMLWIYFLHLPDCIAFDQFHCILPILKICCIRSRFFPNLINDIVLHRKEE